jgi:hypothetical protein
MPIEKRAPSDHISQPELIKRSPRLRQCATFAVGNGSAQTNALKIPSQLL